MMRRFAMAVIAVFVVRCATAHAPDEAQYWSGRAGNVTHGVTIELALRSAPGGMTGTVTIPELGARGIPLERVRVSPAALHFELAFDGERMTFDAARDRDTATGTYAMGPMTGPLTLRRLDASPLVPYAEEPIRFRNGDVQLDGSLLVPPGGTRSSAVVFLHGSGKVTRDANRFLADLLARRGVAALIYDKRGSGRSTGDLRASSYDELAADALAAVDALRRRGDIDADRICLAGASQAGWVGVAAAARTAVHCLAFTSAPVVDVARENWFDYEVRLRRASFGGDAIAAARQLIELDFAVTRNPDRWDELQRATSRARGEAWFGALEYEPLPPNDPARIAFRRVLDFDPLPLLARLDAPSLWIFGGRDTTVPAAWSIDNLAALMKEGKSYTIRMIPEADHAMMLYPNDLAAGGWPRRAPEHSRAVVSWLVEALQRH